LAGAVRGGADQAADAAARLLRHLDADMARAEELLAGMLERRDQWLKMLGVGHGAAELIALRQRIEADVAAVVEEELADLRLQLHALGGPEPPAANQLAPWRECAERWLTAKGEPRKKPKAGGAPVSEAAAAVLHAVRALPEPHCSDEEWDTVAATLALLPRAAAALGAEFQERGTCDFTEITLAAAAALGDSAEPSALAFALDGQLRHLLLDEFQDTSHAQFDLLGALVREWSPGDGRSLFLVGDPMQSIYGWRNAEPGLMLATMGQAQFGPLPLECVRLSANHRSGPALVTWCNEVFSRVAARQDDASLGAAQFVASAAAGAEADRPVLHALPWAAAAAERVAEIAQRELDERGAEADIAVLVQSRSGTEAIMAALRRRDIRPAGIKLQSLAHHPAARDVGALARALRHGADRIAWLAVLRAPWCGLRLADLHALCGGDGAAADALIEERLGDRAALGRLSPDGQQRLARVAAPLLAAAAERGRASLAALTAWCWRALGGEALAGEHVAGALELLALMEQAPEEWEGELERSFAPPGANADQRVQVMTLHQAKGLQFDCVILPGLERSPRAGDPTMLRYRLERARQGEGEHFLMASHPGVARENLLYGFLGGRERRRQEQEQLRMMYVGCTRAKRRLHLVAQYRLDSAGAMVRPPRRAPLARLWLALEEAMRERATSATATAAAPQAGA
ncbi:MAG: UvrD-helicase domain-containing protein, partial [Terriglobales bacterium]